MITLDISSVLELEYCAEGAANIVYRIIPRPSTPSTTADSGFYDFERAVTELAPLQVDPALEGKLVRLRKTTASNRSVLEMYQDYENMIVPIFPRADSRVEQILFKPTPALLAELNRNLKVMEHRQSRLKKRHGTYLAEGESHGLLVTDMSCSDPSSAHLRCFEFKPKWLVQSPSAPSDAVRCRTCAVRNLRRVQSGDSYPTNDHSGFCPLGLVSDNKQVVERTLSTMFEWSSRGTHTDHETSAVRQRLIDLVYKSPLLNHLRILQSKLDPHGILATPDSDSAFLTAMTLRDCTVFIKVFRL